MQPIQKVFGTEARPGARETAMNRARILALVVVLAAAASCDTGVSAKPDPQEDPAPPGPQNPSSKEITAFSFGSPQAAGAIDQQKKTIALVVPWGTSVSALVPTIQHTGASVSPASGTAQDFGSPVAYVVTAKDGSTSTYVAKVTAEALPAGAVWTEKWESDWSADWHVDFANWEVGAPTNVGPPSAHEGSRCAATILDGNYAEDQRSRLIRHTSFEVPGAASNPRLRIWHYYNFHLNDGGSVQVRVKGEADWTTLPEGAFGHGSPGGMHSSGKWTNAWLDLSAYAGKTVELCFYFFSATTPPWGDAHVSSGWYVDEVALEF